MKTLSKRIITCSLRAFLALGVTFFSVSFSAAEEKQASVSPDAGETKKAELQTVEDNFEYQLEGRQDPFEPFLKPKVVADFDPNEIVESDETLTGMQLFEPGQLTLVAIMQTGKDNIAMVEDSTGKGYVVRVGMKIGRRGEIISIDSHKVAIEETAITRAKKVLKTRIDMILNKEGEE